MTIPLHDTLWNLRNEELSMRLKILEVKPDAPNKAGFIKTLKRLYAGDGIRRMWGSLSALQQAAIAEAAYHFEHRYLAGRVQAKYGGLPEFYHTVSVKKSGYSYERQEDIPSRIHLFLYSTQEYPAYFIPSDIAAALQSFVPEPPEAKPEASDVPPEEEGLEVRMTEPEARAEVMALLRLAEAGDMRVSEKTAMPSAVGVRKILGTFPLGDFYPPDVAFLPEKSSWDQEIGAIKPVAWTRLLVHAGYVGLQGNKSKLTGKGLKVLAEAPHKILRELWKKWRDNTRFDEFNRVDAVKGQHAKGHPLTAVEPRRTAIAGALLACPVGQWVDAEKFFAFMNASDHTFEVARLPYRLYFAESHYGNLGDYDYAEWKFLEFRYMLSVLFEYAATLGMIDVAYVHPTDAMDDFGDLWGADELQWLSRYDGLRAFRLNKLGAYCLGMLDDYVPGTPETSLVLEIGANLIIRHTSGQLEAADTLFLEAWAEPVERGVWRLDAALALQAVERGQKSEDFATFLRSRDPQPLPQTVEGFLAAADRDGRAVRFGGEALIFECRDEATSALICSQKELEGICLRCGQAKIAVLASHVEKFRKSVRALRLGIM